MAGASRLAAGRKCCWVATNARPAVTTPRLVASRRNSGPRARRHSTRRATRSCQTASPVRQPGPTTIRLAAIDRCVAQVRPKDFLQSANRRKILAVGHGGEPARPTGSRDDEPGRRLAGGNDQRRRRLLRRAATGQFLDHLAEEIRQRPLLPGAGRAQQIANSRPEPDAAGHEGQHAAGRGAGGEVWPVPAGGHAGADDGRRGRDRQIRVTGFFISPDGTAKYRTGEHDTLSEIASKHLGRSSRWIQIYEMNRDKLSNPNQVKVGLELALPGDASSVGLSSEVDERR